MYLVSKVKEEIASDTQIDISFITVVLPQSPNIKGAQKWKTFPSPSEQITSGMRTLEYNGTDRESSAQKEIAPLGN
jgi:hypothetical protein